MEFFFMLRQAAGTREIQRPFDHRFVPSRSYAWPWPLPLPVTPRALSLRLSFWRVAGTTGRAPPLRPTPGAKVFIVPFAGDEYPPGMPPPPCLPFLCETEHPNPDVSYLYSDLI